MQILAIIIIIGHSFWNPFHLAETPCLPVLLCGILKGCLLECILDNANKISGILDKGEICLSP